MVDLGFLDSLIGFFLQAGILGLFIFALVTVIRRVVEDVGEELDNEKWPDDH